MYTISITGEFLEDTDRNSAISAFAKLFKMDGAKAEQVFSSAPTVIKRNVDAASGQRFETALKNIGVDCILESSVAQTGEQQVVTGAPPVAHASTIADPVAETETDKKVVETPKATNPTEPVSFRGFEFKIEGQPDYSFVTVQVPGNQTIRVEASAMATMSTNMVMKTKAKGGLGRFITGESIFINEFTAEGGSGEIGIAAGAPGDLKHLYLDNEEVFLQNSAFVASGMDVATESKWQGLTKGFFSGESLFLIRCSGTGDLWFNTYGAIIEIDVTDDYVVDTGNIVAFTSGLEYNITKVGGYKSLFFSGEGLVCRFSGKGKVWIQTRGVAAFTAWAEWYRPVEKKK